MLLDLKRDFEEIYAHLANCVHSFEPAGGNVLVEPGPIKAIELGFEYAQSEWFVVVFDTRPEAEPDGEWTSLVDGNELERPHWLEAGEILLEGPLDVVQMDGTKSRLSPETELANVLGEMIKAVLLKARADGLFAGLPKAPNCELLLEHFDGGFGWPDYDSRGQENLA